MIYIVLPQFFERYNFAGSNRVLNYGKGLISNGVNCTIITFSRALQEKSIFDDSIEGVPIVNLQTNKESSFLFLKLFEKFLIRKKLYSYLKENLNREDVVITYFYDLVLSLFVFNVVRKNKFKLVMELNEIPYYNNNIINKFKRWIELNVFFKKYDGIIAISEELHKISEKYKSKNCKLIKIPILINKPIESETAVIKDIVIQNPYIFHAGSMVDFKDGISETLIAFGRIHNKLPLKVDFILVGSKPSNYTKIEMIIKKYNLSDHVKFIHETLSTKEINEYYKNSSLAIINKFDNIQNRYCFPTKLGEILLSKTAVICTNVGETKYFLKNNKSAYIIESGNTEKLAEKILEAFTNVEKRNKIALEGYNIAVKKFDNLYHGKRLASYLTNL